MPPIKMPPDEVPVPIFTNADIIAITPAAIITIPARPTAVLMVLVVSSTVEFVAGG